MDFWSFVLNMSSVSKVKANFTWRASITILLIVNLGGVVDVRKCVEILNKLPDMQRMTEENTREIKAIREILVRHKLADSIESIHEITTAQYE
tara:strand:+ start:2531 stop:2809 length:279 start_codon:yes stop_codon:yes gene_type:complete